MNEKPVGRPEDTQGFVGQMGGEAVWVCVCGGGRLRQIAAMGLTPREIPPWEPRGLVSLVGRHCCRLLRVLALEGGLSVPPLNAEKE